MVNCPHAIVLHVIFKCIVCYPQKKEKYLIQFGSVETVTHALIDTCQRKLFNHQVLVLLTTTATLFVLSLPFAMQVSFVKDFITIFSFCASFVSSVTRIHSRSVNDVLICILNVI